MKPSSLQLNHCTIGEVSLRPNESGNAGEQVNITTNVTYSRNDANVRQWLIKLDVVIKTPDNDRPAPYEGKIEVTGIFTVIGDMPEEQQLKLVAVTCPSILYGTARETIAMLSARGRNGVFLIPSVSFADQKIAIVEKKPAEAVAKT
jgi:preprotein translocase subunit SecB